MGNRQSNENNENNNKKNNLKENNTNKNNMTDNKNNQNLTESEQSSITVGSDINTREGNANIGNAAGDNADYSNKRKSIVERPKDNYGATFAGGTVTFGGGQNLLGGKNDNVSQTNNYADESNKYESAKIKREGLVSVAMAKLGKDIESIKILFEILPSVEEIVKKGKKWEYDINLHLKIESLESKLSNIRDICQAQAEETRLEMRQQQELVAQQQQN